MDFVNPALLAGASLVALPIILHLVMRQKPKHFEFPALRFIQKRQDANRRKLRLRHLLLLLLRVAAIALLAAALARPTLKATGGIGDQEAPVAAALVFDTSPRMEYIHENQSRLAAAQESSLTLLTRLPPESQVAVVDSRHGEPAFQIDLASAKERIGRMQSTAVGRSLGESLKGAVELLAKSELSRKEIYLFTDLAAAAWDDISAQGLQAELARLPEAGLYIVDVGVKSPQNVALDPPRLSAQVLAKNRDWTLSVDLVSTGAQAERLVQVQIPDAEGKPQTRGQETVQLGPGESRNIDFHMQGLETGVHQGHVQLGTHDALVLDDTRYITIEVRPPWNVLLVAADPPEESAWELWEALAPTEFRKSKARFECEVIGFDGLADRSLDEFSAVCLLDPPPLAAAAWSHLTDYVEAGGGLALFLGPAAQPLEAMNQPAALALLPGPLSIQARHPDGNITLNTDDGEHPLLNRFRPLRGTALWEGLPVLRYWQFGELATGVAAIVTYSNNRPALLERTVGKGRVLTLTTPVSEVGNLSAGDARSREGERWNLLFAGFESWPFLMFTNELMLYLVGSTDSRLNYESGQVAVLRLAPEERFESYLLSTPKRDQVRQLADSTGTALSVAATDTVGNYRVRAGGQNSGVQLGFSVNQPAEFSQLERLPRQRLDELLGERPFSLVEDRTQIDRAVHAGRVGRELFAPIMLVIVMVLVGEHLLANRFYRNDAS